MSSHITSFEQAESFIESYYSVEIGKTFVCCKGSGYGVSKNIASLRTKDIARLASEAFENISKPKELMRLYDAIERHVNRLEPAIMRFLKWIHFPFMGSVKACVLHLPFTASASLFSTMKKIDRKISIERLQKIVNSEQDLEDFCLLEEWLKSHQHCKKTLQTVVEGCNKTLKEMSEAKTIQDILQVAGNRTHSFIYRFVGAKRINEILIDLLKRKIESFSSQIAGLPSDLVAEVASFIELLGKDFEETARNLRSQIKLRIKSEATLEGLFKISESMRARFPFSVSGFYIDNKKFNKVIFKVFELESARAKSLEEISKTKETWLLWLSKPIPDYKKKFINDVVIIQKKLFCDLAILDAKTVRQLQLLKENIASDEDLKSCFKDFEKKIAEKIAKMAESDTGLGEVQSLIKNRSFDISDDERKLLKQLPSSNPLRIFAENILVSIEEENVARALGLQDFSDPSAVRSTLRSLQLHVHPDKNKEELKRVATKLWNVLLEIKNHIRTEGLV